MEKRRSGDGLAQGEAPERIAPFPGFPSFQIRILVRDYFKFYGLSSGNGWERGQKNSFPVGGRA
jgi:hypothetical protein